MCDILKTNFEEKFPKILHDIKAATFIAIDCEFTGLIANDDYKASLFDVPKERYAKLREGSKNFFAIQLGISPFKYNRDNGSFASSSYTFYLFPRPFPKLDARFMCQSTSIEFLCNYNLNFNKLFYEGISFLNEADEERLTKQLLGFGLFEGTERDLSYLEEEMIQDYCSQIAAWSATAEQGAELVLDMQNAGTIICYFVHLEVRRRFPRIWTFYIDQYHIKVKMVLEHERAALQRTSKDIEKLIGDVFNSILGFSKLFKELKKLKKPIIGHNLLLDLMIIYKQFIKDLPVSYEEFKNEIHEIFPVLYDTKTISYILRDKLKREDSWHSNSLSNLYDYLTKGKGAIIVLYSPMINIEEGFDFESKNFHESGFDSYCAGSCFIKMAYIFSTWDNDLRYFTTRSLPPSLQEMTTAVSSMKNCINLMRAQVDHIVFGDNDPVSKRPGAIYLQRKGMKALDINEVTEIIAKFGMVDIKPCNRYSVLIAASTKKSARDIITDLNKYKEYKASWYSPLKHSEAAKIAFGISVVAAGAILGFLVSKGWRTLR